MSFISLNKKFSWMLFLTLFCMFSLVNAATVTGSVSNQEGTAIANSFVSLHFDGNPGDNGCEPGDSTNHHAQLNAMTDASGIFTITNVPVGSYTAMAHAQGYMMGFYKNADGQIAVIVIDADEQEVTGINILLGNGNNPPPPQEFGSIAGYVYGNNNNPVPMQSIGLVNSTNPDSLIWAQWATTNMEGRYMLHHVPAGTYQVAVYQLTDPVTLAYTILAVSDVVELVAAAHLDSVNIIMDYQSYTISGIVTNADGQPIANANVEAFTDMDAPEGTNVGFHRFFAHTDATGAYSIEVVPGQYKVCAWGHHFPTIYYPSTYDWMQATPVVVVDQNIVDINMAVPGNAAVHISGIVKDLATGLALAGITVKTDVNGYYHHGHHGHHGNNPADPDSSYIPEYSATTDENGAYSIEVPQGTYKVLAMSADGTYQTQYFDHVNAPFLATVIHANSDVADVNFDLITATANELYSISGTITENDTLVNYPVMVAAISENHTWVVTTMSDSTGSYTITNLMPGNYYVVAHTPFSPPLFYLNALTWEDAQLVTVDGHIIGINFNFIYTEVVGPYSLIGNVVDNNNDPLSNVVVILKDNQNQIVGFASTDDNGAYSVSNLSTENYTVVATKIGLNSLQENIAVDGNQNYDFSMASPTGNSDVNVTTAKLSVTNYPNPFNPSTSINFSIPMDSNVNVEIFNIKGQKVRTLLSENMVKGSHTVAWNGQDSKGKTVTSGIYFVKVQGAGFEIMRKMSLIK